MKTSFGFLVLFVCVLSVKCYDFGSNFKVCHRSDPQLDKCLVNAISTGLKLLKDGLPELEIPSIDPLKVSKLTIGAGSKAVNLVQHYFNVTTTGLSNFKIKQAHFDSSKNVLTFVLTHPLLKQTSQYELNGKVLVLPVRGKGDSELLLKDAVLTHVMTLGEETKNNKKYFTIKNYDGTISVGHAHFDFKNLFDGDKKLGDPILSVVNENWNTIFNDVKGEVQSAYAKIFNSIAKKLFSQIPADDIFPN